MFWNIIDIVYFLNGTAEINNIFLYAYGKMKKMRNYKEKFEYMY